MRVLYSIIVFQIAFITQIKSQFANNVAYQKYPIELPTSMVNFDNFSLIVSTSIDYFGSGWASSGDLIISGIKTDGSLMFRKSIKYPYATGYGNFLNEDNLIKCLPTSKKGLFTLNKALFCSNPTSGFGTLQVYTIVDSLGNVKNNQQYSYASNYKDIGIVNGSFYYICNEKEFKKVNSENGQIISTPFYTSTNTVITTAAFNSNRILIESTGRLNIIDTSGNILLDKSNSATYSKIKFKNTNFYCYNDALNKLEKLDTGLNVIRTLTLSSINKLTDFSITNDTIYIVNYNAQTYKSSITVVDSAFNLIDNKTIEIENHKIINVNKTNKINFLATEINAKYTGPHSRSAYDCGLISINNLNEYNFEDDLVITDLKNISLDSIKHIPYGAYYNYIYYYTNELTIKNNGPNTINKLKLFEDYNGRTIINGNHNICFSSDIGDLDHRIISPVIAPYSSINYQYKGSIKLYITSPLNEKSIDALFFYYVTLPNDHFEKNIINSAISKNLHLEIKESVSEPIITPNPTNSVLNLFGSDSTSPILVYDSIGKLVIYSEQNKSIDVSTLSNGIYFVKYTLNGISKITKLIKTD